MHPTPELRVEPPAAQRIQKSQTDRRHCRRARSGGRVHLCLLLDGGEASGARPHRPRARRVREVEPARRRCSGVPSALSEGDLSRSAARGEAQSGALRAASTPPPHPASRSRERDRKSTRLNSSHANISYAVFCLKKKK